MGLGHYEGGGFTTVVNMLSKHLQKMGVEVTVVSPVKDFDPPKYVNFMKLPANAIVREASKYDLVHIHLTYLYLKKLINSDYSRFILTHHGYTPWHLVPGYLNKLIQLYLKYRYKKILPKIRYRVATSLLVKNQLHSMYNLSSQVIPNGVEMDVFKPIKTEEKAQYPILFNVTGYYRFKGADLLLQHFSILKEQYPNAKLIVVALPLNSSWVKRIIKKNGLKIERDIFVLPILPQEKLVYYYNLADFYLLTSRWESFGLPIIESFACGTPVVAMDRGDARRGHIVDSGAGVLYDEGSLLEAVDEVLSNKAGFRRKALNYASKFDWNLIAKQYLGLYREVTT